MPAPTFVAEYESVWNTNSQPKTASVTVSAGDALVVVGVTEEAGSTTINTPTGGGLTYTLAQSIVVSTYTAAYIWTAPAPTSQTFTLSVGAVNIGFWGFNCLRFSGSTGFGGSNKTNTTGAPSLALTTTAANSAVVVVNGDWNAADGTTRTPRSIGTGSFAEQTYFRDASHYTVYAGYYADSGAAGSKTVGWSQPTGQQYALAAVEVLGTAGGGATTSTPPPLLASPWRRRLPLLVR